MNAIVGAALVGVPLARSHRRLLAASTASYVTSTCLILALQVLTLATVFRIAGLFAPAAVAALGASGITVTTRAVAFLNGSLSIALVDVRPPNLGELLICIFAGVVVIAAVRIKQQPTPLRYLAVFAALVLIVSALQLLLMGRPSYEFNEFSALWLRSSLIIWALGPTLLGVASMLFPFRTRERLVLIVAALIFDIIFSIARYVVLLALVSACGPIIYPLALTFGGTVVDAFIFVTFYSRALCMLSERLARAPELWRWSLR